MRTKKGANQPNLSLFIRYIQVKSVRFYLYLESIIALRIHEGVTVLQTLTFTSHSGPVTL